MNTESLLLLQKLDCNCNDCVFMNRDIKLTNSWIGYRSHIQYIEFLKERRRLLKLAGELIWPSPRHPKPTEATIREGKLFEYRARKMKFQFNREGVIGYGNCAKLNKQVSFLPDTCQVDTQECFKHRRD